MSSYCVHTVLYLSHLLLLAIKYTIFFFNDTATTEIYTLSLHDALPISSPSSRAGHPGHHARRTAAPPRFRAGGTTRSEEHTSELQSPCNLVCRLLLEKKKSLQAFEYFSFQDIVEHEDFETIYK